MNGLWTRSLQLDRPTPASHTMAFTPQCSLAMTHFNTVSISGYAAVLVATHLATQVFCASFLSVCHLNICL